MPSLGAPTSLTAVLTRWWILGGIGTKAGPVVTIPISCTAASSRIKGDEAPLAPATRSSHKVLCQGDSIFTVFCRAGLKTKRYHQAGGCREGEAAALAARAPVWERCTAFNKQGPFLILFAPELVCSLAAGGAWGREDTLFVLALTVQAQHLREAHCPRCSCR